MALPRRWAGADSVTVGEPAAPPWFLLGVINRAGVLLRVPRVHRDMPSRPRRAVAGRHAERVGRRHGDCHNLTEGPGEHEREGHGLGVGGAAVVGVCLLYTS